MATPLVSIALAQPRPGVISGQVVDGVSGKPVGAAIVAISGTPLVGLPAASQPARILTGSDGRFAFTNLEPGAYGVTATKGGYAEGEPGRRRPGGQAPAITLTATQFSADVRVPMWRYSVISGTVTDDAGEAVVGMQMRALARLPGAKTFLIVKTTFTDDRGSYRFGDLAPGRYLVAATPVPSLEGAAPPRGSRVQLYPTTFYPSTPAPAQSSTIELAAGDERSGIDIQIAPAPAARVSGLLLGASGLNAAKTTIRLSPVGLENISGDAVAVTTVTDGEGRFTFTGVTPGRYALRATAGASGALAYAELPVTVAGDDIDDLVAAMRLPLRISAQARYEGTRPSPTVDGRTLNGTPFLLEAVEGTIGPVSIAGGIGDNGMYLTGYSPGRYRLFVANPPSGWMIKAALLNGVDVLETPFDFTKDITSLTLVFTDRVSGVTGRVEGAGANSADVFLFRTDAAAWRDASLNDRRFRTARVSARGEFTIDAVPPGDYFVVAVRDEDAGDWRDPATLESLARSAAQISIIEGEMKALTLRLQDVR